MCYIDNFMILGYNNKKIWKVTYMKTKTVLWIIGIVVAVAAVAAGVALFVTRFLAEEDEENYIECEVGADE